MQKDFSSNVTSSQGVWNNNNKKTTHERKYVKLLVAIVYLSIFNIQIILPWILSSVTEKSVRQNI